MDRFFERLPKRDETKDMVLLIDLLRGICRITIEQRAILSRTVDGIFSDDENLKRSELESLRAVLNERPFKHDHNNILDLHKSIDNFADDFLVKSKDESKVTWA